MPLLLVAVAWAAQGGTLANGWVWDDAILIRDGADVHRGFSALRDAWTSPWGGDEQAVGLYRPFVTATLALQAGIHGASDPFPFHLANLFLHGLAAVLLLGLLNRVLPRRPVVSSGAALLFAAHPLHAGTVSWIVARGDLLAAVFGLSAALVWTRPRGSPVVTVVATALLSFLAVLSKEAAVVLLPVLVILDVLVRDGSVTAALRRRAAGYAVLLLPLAAWAVMRGAAVGWFDATEANSALAGRNLGDRLMIGAGALARNLVSLLVPAGFCGDGSGDPVLARGAEIPFAYVLSLVLLAAAVVLLSVRFLLGKRSVPEAALGLSILLAVPVLQIVPLGAVFEDRFAYLPSLAFLLLPAWFAERLLATRARRLAFAAAAAVLLAFGAASWAVAGDWRDEDAFDRALLADDPRHVKALARLGRDLRERGSALRRKAEEFPSTPQTRPAIDAAYRRAGVLLDESVAFLERARFLTQGRRVSVLRTLANSYMALLEPRAEAAEATIAELLALKRVRIDGRVLSWEQVADEGARDRASPADRALFAEMFAQRARAASLMGDRSAAAGWWAEAARWGPFDRVTQRQAGAIWMEEKRPDVAIPFLERALALSPPDERKRAKAELDGARDAARRLATDKYVEALEAAKRPESERVVRNLCEEAIRFRPDYVAPRLLKAETHRKMGDFRAARVAAEEAQEVLRQRPPGSTGEDDAVLGERLARLLADIERDMR